MRTGRNLVVAAGLALLLAGCVTEGGAYQSYGYAPSGYGTAPGYGYGPGYASPYGSPYGGGGYGYGRPSYGYGYDEPRRMSGRSMAALAEGCRQRFYPGTNKYNQCVNGERKSEDSLVEGCTRMYRNDPNAYGKCLRGR